MTQPDKTPLNCVSKKNTPSNIKIVSPCQTHHHSLFGFFFFPPVFLSPRWGNPTLSLQSFWKIGHSHIWMKTSSLQSLQFVRRVGADTAAHTLCNLEPMLTLLAESIMFPFHTGRDRCSFINVCTTRLPRPSAAELDQPSHLSGCLLWLAALPSQEEASCVCCCPEETGRQCRGGKN